MSNETTARGRLEAFLEARRNNGDALHLECEDAQWTVRIHLQLDDTRFLKVAGHSYFNGIEESAADVIDKLAEAGIEVP